MSLVLKLIAVLLYYLLTKLAFINGYYSFFATKPVTSGNSEFSSEKFYHYANLPMRCTLPEGQGQAC